MAMQKREEPHESIHHCCWDNCSEPADCPAPKSRATADSESFNTSLSPFRTPERYYWFCRKHATEYNSKWNYFSGMDSESIEHFIDESTTGHRPTWKMGSAHRCKQNSTDALYEALHTMFVGDFHHPQAPRLTENERKSLALLNLSLPLTRAELKSRYKHLVKEYHPDLHRGDSEKEEFFKQINEAYRILRESRYIKESK